MCCGGQKTSCVWQPGGGSAKNKKAKKIIDKCIKRHENDHHDDIDCPPGPGVTRPDYRAGKNANAEECSAYKIEVACYKSSISDCDLDPQCINEVLAELKFASGQARKLCGP